MDDIVGPADAGVVHDVGSQSICDWFDGLGPSHFASSGLDRVQCGAVCGGAGVEGHHVHGMPALTHFGHKSPRPELQAAATVVPAVAYESDSHLSVVLRFP